MNQHRTMNKWVGYWLLTGCVMIVIQVLLGGITRLTGSGLSITEWKAIMGFIPPLNAMEWNIAFEKYKASSQFQLINSTMDLSGFKQIFFWEYFHRLWARGIGAVFMFAFIFFVIKKWLTKEIIPHLVVLFLLGGLQGFIGWLMVSTGLKERAWVTPLSLTVHLILATVTFMYLLWIYVKLFKNQNIAFTSANNIYSLTFLIFLCIFQMMLGGFMAGTHAALHFPTWPSMNGMYFPETIYNQSVSVVDNFLENITFIQFMHRNTAYILSILVLLFWFNNRHQIKLKSFNLLPFMILLQVLMGVITLLFSTSTIPVFWGVAHQLGALFLLALLLLIRLNLKTKKAIPQQV